MNRRNFLKLMAAGATPLAVSLLCNLPLETLVPSPTAASPTAQSTFTPIVLPPSATPTMGPVPTPIGGLGSDYNYYFSSDCNPITGLTITIDITKDIVVAAPATGIGFSFQLNTYPPAGANCNWQQYVIKFDVTNQSSLTCIAELVNWLTDQYMQTNNIAASLGSSKTMLTLPTASLPAGYKLIMTLKNDENAKVNGITYAIVDSGGKTTSLDMMIETLPLLGTRQKNIPVPPDLLTTINSFQLNLVGPNAGQYTYLSSGGGTFAYSATTPLRASNKNVQCIASPAFTAETANSIYGTLLPGSSPSINQTFDIEEPPLCRRGTALAVSQQFGINQTDLFVISGRAQLSVFSVLGDGTWNPLKPIGPAGLFYPGVPFTVCKHSGVDNQTDVFLFDQNLNLNMFWAVGAGDWNGPKRIGPASLVGGGFALAASPHVGVDNRTDVFLVDQKGQLYVLWALGAGNWNGPEPIGPKGFASRGPMIAASGHFGVDNQMDVFVTDQKNQINVFSSVSGGTWSGPKTIGMAGLSRAGAFFTVSQRFGKNDQTDLYIVDIEGRLNVFSSIGSGDWSGPQTIGPVGLATPGATVAVAQKPGTTDQTDVFLIDKNGQLNVYSLYSNGRWGGLVKVGSQNLASSGSPLVVSPQFGVSDRLDVFVIGQTDSNHQWLPALFSQVGTNPWQGPDFSLFH